MTTNRSKGVVRFMSATHIFGRTLAGVAALLLCVWHGDAQAQFGGPPPPPPSPARDVGPWDPTGQWVSVVTEDWRFRMVTAPKNDYTGLPLTVAARERADAWDPQADAANGLECRAYGAGGIMRIPTRLRISWDGESTLRIDTDAGRQRRELHFDGTEPAPGEPSWQGQSVAQWEMHGGGFGSPPVNGTIRAVTTNMRPGYFRKNGIGYGENAVLTEYFDLQEMHDGTQWLVVVSRLVDPENFFAPVITSTNFRRQSDRSGWNPQDCRVD